MGTRGRVSMVLIVVLATVMLVLLLLLLVLVLLIGDCNSNVKGEIDGRIRRRSSRGKKDNSWRSRGVLGEKSVIDIYYSTTARYNLN